MSDVSPLFKEPFKCPSDLGSSFLPSLRSTSASVTYCRTGFRPQSTGHQRLVKNPPVIPHPPPLDGAQLSLDSETLALGFTLLKNAFNARVILKRGGLRQMSDPASGADGSKKSPTAELKRDGQRENTAVSFRRKAIAVSHPSFNAGGDASVPYRSLLFRDARQRAECSLGDLERPRNTTTAETKRPFKTTGLIYERGRETRAKLIVGNARAGQRYVQDILSLAPGPVESLGGPYDRFLWCSMVMSLIWAARPPHRRTRDIGSTSCARTTSTTTSVPAANGFQRGVHSGLRSNSSLEFGFSSLSKCGKPHEMLRCDAGLTLKSSPYLLMENTAETDGPVGLAALERAVSCSSPQQAAKFPILARTPCNVTPTPSVTILKLAPF
ncbi:hypothetical protein E1301_Tti019394 [Triplophysa tibetana]|uniref:Uncharacterized protein n=1 Tax=Triplophysa tibetana TaxID=1572043 RepID=A0A5A9NG83_9TELE|nr:hypothetical protein E1301_Tti019394 [Triplophysa tibetana]